MQESQLYALARALDEPIPSVLYGGQDVLEEYPSLVTPFHIAPSSVVSEASHQSSLDILLSFLLLQ